MAQRTAWRTMDEDGGVTSITNNGLWQTAYSYTSNNGILVVAGSVTIFDAAAFTWLQWRVTRNGSPINKLQGLKTFCYLGQDHEVRIGELLFPLELLTVDVLNPAASPAAFDVVARLTSQETRR